MIAGRLNAAALGAGWEVRVGDVLYVLRAMPEGSVQMCATSPPYFGLRDYKLPPTDWPAVTYGTLGGEVAVEAMSCCLGLEPTPDAFVGHLVLVFREVRRVLRDDGTVWLNLGDSYASGDRGYRTHDSKAPGARGMDVRPRDPDGIKPKDLLGIPWMVAFALRADGWYLRSDIIWCLSGGARVYVRTQKGDMPMTIKDLVRLDPSTVKLWNGEKWTQALGWSRSETRDGALEIELRSGERIGCTPGHVWPTQRGNVRTDALAIGDVLATTTLPEPDEPRTPAALDARVGWMAGRYLADGSTSGDTVQIACHRDEADTLALVARDFAQSFHGTAVAHRSRSSLSATVNINGPLSAAVIRAYVYGTSAHDKGIHPRAWQRSNTFLRAMLDGYLSGDGHYDAPNDRWRLGFTRNDRLAGDLRTLAARLGCSLTLKATTGTGFGRTWAIYRGELRFVAPVHHNARDRGEVVAIRRSRARQFWDVGVADEPHTFALASGVLTHNSKPNPMPESVRDRCTRAHENVFAMSKKARYFYDAEAIKEQAIGKNRHDLTGNGYSAPGQTVQSGNRKDLHGPTYSRHRSSVPGDQDLRKEPTGGRNKRSVWDVPEEIWSQFVRWLDEQSEGSDPNVWRVTTQPFPGAHFAVFPEKLVEPMILAGSSPRACGECGAPWRRVVKQGDSRVGVGGGTGYSETVAQQDFPGSNGRRGMRGDGFAQGEVLDERWEPSCAHHDDSGRSVVLDPFTGACTTGLVALRHGREFIGVELNADYARMGRERILASMRSKPKKSRKREGAAT